MCIKFVGMRRSVDESGVMPDFLEDEVRCVFYKLGAVVAVVIQGCLLHLEIPVGIPKHRTILFGRADVSVDWCSQWLI